MTTRPTAPIRLYTHPISGHAHRVELMLSLLGLPFEKHHVDLMKGEQKRPEFLAKNPFGVVPVIEDGDVTVADSNAILVYLALSYDPTRQWLPSEPAAAAEVQRWLSVAAGNLAMGPATARIEVLFGRPRTARSHELSRALFQVLEGRLRDHAFLVGAAPTLADVALYTYTSHAPEGGVSLADWPAIRAWLARIEALPGYVGMQRAPDGPALAA